MLTPQERTRYLEQRRHTETADQSIHNGRLAKFRILYSLYRSLYQKVPAALVAQGWPATAHDFTDDKLATTVVMLYLGGTQELTALHAALLANGNHTDIDTIVQSLDNYAFTLTHRDGQTDTRTDHELRHLLKADNSEIRTDTLLQILYNTHNAINQFRPPPDTPFGNAFLQAATRILETVLTILYARLSL